MMYYTIAHPETDDGISLRDWFAGQALSGLLASGPHDCGPGEYASDAYLFADAMLTRRAEAGENE